ncbi:MAG: OmpA family protein [Proteobacteria bacterium]|nr:OmpA family protein [Pseudomonadota bacterium]MBU1714616.1 OmpA family protein [Pseudomonadota bacterium]
MEEEVKQKKCKTGGAWITTFADLMSLLMCFFILLLSFSEMDKQKFKAVAGSMEQAFGIQKDDRQFGSPEGNVLISAGFMSTPIAVKLQQAIDEVVAEEMASGDAELDVGPNEMTLRIKGSVAFDLGKADIRNEFKPLLDKLGKVFRDEQARVTVNGHTDDLPLIKKDKFKSNWGLSTARSVEVVEYWIGKFKIPPEHLVAAGYADGLPLVKNDSDVNRARNRRVEFVIRPRAPGEVFDGLETTVRP